MNAPLVSIIATFYNQSRYIPRLIKSVLSQTYKDWELICVNDCSSDATLKKLRKYSTKYPSKIRVITNPSNQGASRSRHIGVEKANGEFLTFIDGDDWIDSDYVETMVNGLFSEKKDGMIDLVLVNVQRAIPYTSIRRPQVFFPPKNEVLTQPRIMDDYYLNFFGIHFFMTGYWGKLYRTELVKSLDFKPIDRYYCEDEEFMLHLWPQLNKIVFLDYSGYNWRWSSGVTSKKIKERGHYILSNAVDYYNVKKAMINKHNYQKALRYAMSELKNTLKDCIDTRYPLTNKKSNNELEFLNGILKQSEWSELKFLLQFGDNPLIEAIIKRDSKTVYNIIRKNKPRHQVRNFIYDCLGAIIRLFP